jgi:hypothetical protein
MTPIDTSEDTWNCPMAPEVYQAAKITPRDGSEIDGSPGWEPCRNSGGYAIRHSQVVQVTLCGEKRRALRLVQKSSTAFHANHKFDILRETDLLAPMGDELARDCGQRSSLRKRIELLKALMTAPLDFPASKAAFGLFQEYNSDLVEIGQAISKAHPTAEPISVP